MTVSQSSQTNSNPYKRKMFLVLAEPINVSSSICNSYTTSPNSLQSLALLYTLQTGNKRIKSFKIFPTLQVGADLLK